ncbi:ZIP family metal transporter [Gilvimarinus sp. DA14]|uniref:ZIP family metal transporter n=1 Tax=Gilvimarinus sp. DA14 TaxID=2956798 RepID=UPI0020B8C5C6|nr:ZIP family metal transporter [Gilvimarinus sp. DA14]UTF59202.1 ZIP family metal transporter [Gilvimarinus sp. DA14]
MLLPENTVWLGFIGSLIAGSMTGVGALGVFFIRRLSTSLEDILLSAAAGVMLAASIFSLLLPGIEEASAQGFNASGSVIIVLSGMMLGAAALAIIYRCTPHQHFRKPFPDSDSKALKRIWLFVLAIALHNFPEGMAVGVGFAKGDLENGLTLTLGIGLQNIPEGLAVAISLLAVGYRSAYAFSVAFLTGLIEPVGGLFGAALVSISQPLLPWVLGGAAGAMLFVISDEIIPQTHNRGHEGLATFSLLGGFAVMMYLDTVFA